MTRTNEHAELQIDIRKLSLINELARLGTSEVAKTLGTLADEDAELEVTRTAFISTSDIDSQVDDTKRVGIRVRLRDVPNGHILVLFPERSARVATQLLLSDVVDDMDEVSGELARSAIEELGHMLVSGFVDGWADALGTGIDASTPQLVYAPANQILSRTANLSGEQLVLLFDSKIQVPNRKIEAEIYAVPELAAFVRMINALHARRS